MGVPVLTVSVWCETGRGFPGKRAFAVGAGQRRVRASPASGAGRGAGPGRLIWVIGRPPTASGRACRSCRAPVLRPVRPGPAGRFQPAATAVRAPGPRPLSRPGAGSVGAGTGRAGAVAERPRLAAWPRGRVRCGELRPPEKSAAMRKFNPEPKGRCKLWSLLRHLRMPLAAAFGAAPPGPPGQCAGAGPGHLLPWPVPCAALGPGRCLRSASRSGHLFSAGASGCT